MDRNERIAKRYCELMGIDPDAMIAHGADPDRNGIVHAVLLYSPAWKRIERDVPSQLAWFTAITEQPDTPSGNAK